jgi:hypothetical protein
VGAHNGAQWPTGMKAKAARQRQRLVDDNIDENQDANRGQTAN